MCVFLGGLIRLKLIELRRSIYHRAATPDRSRAWPVAITTDRTDNAQRMQTGFQTETRGDVSVRTATA